MAAQRVRRTLLVAAQWTISIAVIGGMAFLLASRGAQLRGLLTLSAGTVATLAVGAFVLFILNALVLQTLARTFDVHLPIVEITIISIVDSTLNYLPLKTGTVATGTLLFSRHRLSPARYAAMVTGGTVVNVWVCTTLGGALLLARGTEALTAVALLVVPTLGLAVLVIWGLGFRGHVPDSDHPHWLVRVTNRVLDGVRAIFADLVLVAKLIIINGLRVAVLAAQLMVAFNALSTPIGWGEAFIMSSLATILGRLSIIPGGLGIREGGVAGVAALLGISATVGLAASVIERSITVIVTALFGIPATLYVSRTTPWAQLTHARERKQEP